MRWLRDVDDTDWMVRTAATAVESERLRTEADALQRIAHPGVVEIGPMTTDSEGLVTMRTRYVGPDLGQRGPLPPAEIAGLGAALATVLADLHELGIVHGRLEPAHVLVDAGGRPVLCGFGPTAGADPAADVDALRRLLAAQLSGSAPRRLAKLLSERSHRGRATTARLLAEELAHCLADARLPPSEDPGVADPGPTARPHAIETGPGGLVTRHPLRAAPDPPHPPAPGGPSGRRAPALALAAVGAIAVSVGVGFALWPGHGGRRVPAPVSSAACPAVDDGCGPVSMNDGVFGTASGRFAIDVKPVVVVVGRWFCGGRALPAALDPATGQVWIWRAWPGDQVLTARTVATVSRAVGLRVRPRPSGCDQLAVQRRDVPPVVLEPMSGA